MKQVCSRHARITRLIFVYAVQANECRLGQKSAQRVWQRVAHVVVEPNLQRDHLREGSQHLSDVFCAPQMRAHPKTTGAYSRYHCASSIKQAGTLRARHFRLQPTTCEKDSSCASEVLFLLHKLSTRVAACTWPSSAAR